MPLAELHEWEQLEITEGFGEVRADLRMAQLAQLSAAKPTKLLDWVFSPDLRPPPAREESLLDMARAWGAEVPNG